MDDKSYLIEPLDWDTAYFGLPCGRVVLKAPLSQDDWEAVLNGIRSFPFVTISNQFSEPNNARFLGQHTTAFLADTNIQFEQAVTSDKTCAPVGVTIVDALMPDPAITDMAVFEHSKFVTDPGLKARGGAGVYRQWVQNAFDKPGKFFAIDRDDHGIAQGFLLFHVEADALVIELISAATPGRGVGRRLMQAVFAFARDKGCQLIRVGTQVTNTPAMNFYQRMGFHQTACHQTYHLWR